MWTLAADTGLVAAGAWLGEKAANAGMTGSPAVRGVTESSPVCGDDWKGVACEKDSCVTGGCGK